MTTTPARPAVPAARPLVEQTLAGMTLREKAGQMTQVDCTAVTPADVAAHGLGSVLSGGGRGPADNTPAAWADMVGGFAEAATRSRAGVPLVYGVDAVHGHNNVAGAVVFPHNIGLGASGDPELVRRVARATAEELVATRIRWTFAPTVAVAQDIRWGRTYEAFAGDPDLVARLGAAHVRGLQEPDGGGGLSHPLAVLATAKHYVADGATAWGSARPLPWVVEQWSDADMGQRIDQGDADIDEETLRRVHLPPYAAAIGAGVGSVMASYSSWQGAKLHGHTGLLTDVLKGELGFAGLVVSDWMAIDQLDADYDRCVVAAVNAGLDMVMVPFDHQRFIGALERAVQSGIVPITRVDDAVRRILLAKEALGLFAAPVTDPSAGSLGTPAHRAIAREAVAASAVLLRDDHGVLPLRGGAPLVVAGEAADDLGLQCGGWTLSWQGQRGNDTVGTTLLAGLREELGRDAVVHLPDGRSSDEPDWHAPVAIVVVAEEPYAEGYGDRQDLRLPAADIALVEHVRARCDRLVLVLYSGRPLLLERCDELADAIVAAWLPGTQGEGLADVLLGRRPFTGTLPFPWPRTAEQVALPAVAADAGTPRWPAGHSA